MNKPKLLKIKKYIEDFHIMGDYGSGAMCISCKAHAEIDFDRLEWMTRPSYIVEHKDNCEFVSIIDYIDGLL